METFEQKIARLVKEKIAIVPYDPHWPVMFEQERRHLFSCLPRNLIKRVEHFGSTAVPGLSAKPIIDILVEVTSLFETRQRIVPILLSQGYEYYWRPSFGDDLPPFYAWFIKRDKAGSRTHHIHMIESHFEHWQRLHFRDYLIANPDIAREYENLKISSAALHHDDREAYTDAKGAFITRITKKAKGRPPKKEP